MYSMVNPTHTLLLLELHRTLYTFRTNLQQCTLPANIYISIKLCHIMCSVWCLWFLYIYTYGFWIRFVSTL